MDNQKHRSQVIMPGLVVHCEPGTKDLKEEDWPETEEQPGGSCPSQYALPDNAFDLQDLIEYREMNFALGTIFKACYRFGKCSHSDKMRDMRKIRWFADREIARLAKEE